MQKEDQQEINGGRKMNLRKRVYPIVLPEEEKNDSTPQDQYGHLKINETHDPELMSQISSSRKRSKQEVEVLEAYFK